MRIKQLLDEKKSSNSFAEEIWEYHGIGFQRYIELYQKMSKKESVRVCFSLKEKERREFTETRLNMKNGDAFLDRKKCLQNY